MKRAFVFLIMIGFAATLSAQSLVSLARVEKARRASLGGRHAPVITNADLFKVKIRPAVEIGTAPEEEPGIGEELSAETEGGAPAESTPAEGQPGVAAGAASTAAAEPTTEAPDVIPALREKLQAAEELIDLYTTKIAALNQDFSSQTNMTPNYVIEQQLTETLKKLQAAQTEATKLRMEIDQKRIERRANPSPVR